MRVADGGAVHPAGRARTTFLLSFAAAALLSVRCGSDHSATPAADAASPSATSAPPPSAPDAAGAAHEGGVVGAIDGGVVTKLPPLPSLTNVVATENDDSASITFDPVEGALDYRVYPLPADGDISVASDGHVTVHNGTYRCSGDRESPSPNVEDAGNTGAWVTTKVGDTVGGYPRTMADATLGYVYTAPGPGLVPVYALGESDPNADDGCYFARWAASRTKRYTTSTSERTQLLAGWARDDGIAFYVPSAASATTTQVYLDEDGAGTKFQARYYVADGPEGAAHPNKNPAFPVLAKPAPGALPLMRVFYGNACGWSHDELAVGQERFNRIYKQGDLQRWWSLLWTGITGPTTLVVEALDTGCPYQGHVSPQSIPPVTAHFGNTPLLHPPYVTLDEVRAASPTSEVFINGQHGPPWAWNGGSLDGGTADGATPAQLADQSGMNQPLPKAIARSFVQVGPKPHPAMDFFAAFSPGSTPEAFTTVPCGVQGGNCFATWRQQSPTFDQMFIDVEYLPDGGGLFAYGAVSGEWWVTYGDVGGDTNGKYRLTAKQKGRIDDSTFLHVTMEVDAYSTDRRYPQLLISDQDAPVQYNLPQGHTLVIQPRGETTAWAMYPIDYDLQICNMRTWDVNNQCPQYDLYHVLAADGGTVRLAPNEEVGEHASVDHRVAFDVYASTQRAYLFLDGAPYACADLPSADVPSGPVTVTWGDVLYHSQVDHNFAFHTDHMQIETRRHFDNLGFSSGVPAPTWDETRLPCAAPITP
jgi:hypothetical protein